MSGPVPHLLPCPFCGGEAKRITIGRDEPNNAGGDVICCTRCQASSHVEFGRKENLVSRWNARPSVHCDCFGESGLQASTHTNYDGARCCDLCGRPVYESIHACSTATTLEAERDALKARVEALVEALGDCEEAIAHLDEGALGFVEQVADFETGECFIYPLRDELLAKIHAVLSLAKGEQP